MSRPLFNKTTDELEQLFRECRNSSDQLKILAEELRHRQRPKAITLRKKVESALLETELPNEQQASTESTQTPDGSAETAAHDNRARTKPQTQQRNQSIQEFTPPEKFTLVQPLGIRPRPNAYRPQLQDDLRLQISENDPPATHFKSALTELIREMKRRRAGHQQFTLEDGELVNTESGGYSYQFEFGEDANIFEGEKVDLIIGGRVVVGCLTGIIQGRIIVTVQENFGQTIGSCILRIDNTALLQALRDRMERIERGEAPGFRAEFAACLLKNAGAERPAAPISQWPWPQRPTTNQKKFVETALANEISWLFGPPGTGKTDALSALARILYEKGERVLVCSNTNQAVDQLLLKLCRKMKGKCDPALEDGRVVRLGRIEDELENEFGEFVVPERIVERKSKILILRKAELERELDRLARQVAHAEEILRRFLHLAEAKKAFSNLVADSRDADRKAHDLGSTVSTAQSRLAQLDLELKDWEHAGAFRRLLMRSEKAIRLDSMSQQSRLNQAKNELNATKQRVAQLQGEHRRITIELKSAEKAITPATIFEEATSSDLAKKIGPQDGFTCGNTWLATAANPWNRFCNSMLDVGTGHKGSQARARRMP